MNWEAVGAIGEIVGAAAVVISLIYLALQIRAQNREARRAAMHEFSEGFRDTMATFASDSEIAKIFIRGNDDFAGLSDDEKLRMIVGWQRMFRVWEEGYHEYKAARLEARIWNPMVRQLASFLASPVSFIATMLDGGSRPITDIHAPHALGYSVSRNLGGSNQ